MFSVLRTVSAVTAVLLAPAMVHAASFTLDFGDVTASNFGTSGNLEIQYLDVAEGINATLTAAETFGSRPRSNNGAVSGDIRVNATENQTVAMTLTLFDASIGDGFSTLYDPGTDYDWDLGFYDIDGWNTRTETYYDVVTIDTSAIGSLSYTVTESTDLVITADETSVSFSGELSGGIPGQSGLDGELSQAQSDVSMILNLQNTPVLSFDYTVIDTRNDSRSTSRNLLVDGGAISLAGSTVTTAIAPIAPVPLPASALLLVAGVGVLGALRRCARV